MKGAMPHRPAAFDRRTLLTGAAGAGGMFLLGVPGCRGLERPLPPRRKPRDPDSKLRIGVVGVGGRGGANLRAVRGERIAALCDVDARRLEKAARAFPKARRFADYRRMLAEVPLDAVDVSTPDHLHEPVALAALWKGLDVYLEKPLAHAPAEARRLRLLAERTGAVTQMGIQIHAGENYRRTVEWVRSGVIGPITEVHVFCDKSWTGHGRRLVRRPRPPWLEWDLWLGPARARPYVEGLHPANWRRYWDFGTGTLGDMGCHYLDLAHWALDLGVPKRIEAEGPDPEEGAAPPWLHARWGHAARSGAPGVSVHWYDGGKRPEALARIGMDSWRNGVLFLGQEGWILADYGRRLLGPKARFRNWKPPEPSIPPSIGHHREWIAACKARTRTTCDFSYSAPLSETVLLATVAYRLGRALDYDPIRGTVLGGPEAAALCDPPHRPGF